MTKAALDHELLLFLLHRISILQEL